MTSNTVQRPWGSYRIIEQGPGYQIKMLTISPGAKLSDQKHKHRRELWTPIEGVLFVSLGGIEKIVYENQSLSIAKDVWHRLENKTGYNSDRHLSLIEIQTGDSFDEEDIERRADDYGRV